MVAEVGSDEVEVVGEGLGLDPGFGFGYTGFGDEAGDLGAGEIGLLAVVAAVADGENCGAGIDCEAF